MDGRDGIIIGILVAMLAMLSGVALARHSIVSDCDVLGAVVLNGQAYTCFQEVEEETE